MNRLEVPIEESTGFWYSSRVIDQGDLSTYYGYETFDATGYTIKAGKVSPRTLTTPHELTEKQIMEELRAGFTYVRVNNVPIEWLDFKMPIHLISKTFETPEFNLGVGINPTFLLEKEGVMKYAIINGFLIDLDNGSGYFKNAMLFR